MCFEWGRFINADDVEYLGISGTALSYNLYAYCENDPVNRTDPTGEFSFEDLKDIFVKIIELMKGVIKRLPKEKFGIWKEGSYLNVKVSSLAFIIDGLITAGNIVTSAVKATAIKTMCSLAVDYAQKNPRKVTDWFLRVFKWLIKFLPDVTTPIIKTFANTLGWKVTWSLTKTIMNEYLIKKFTLYAWINALKSPGTIIGTILDVLDADKRSGIIKIKRRK